jgi:hypothetical protein
MPANQTWINFKKIFSFRSQTKKSKKFDKILGKIISKKLNACKIVGSRLDFNQKFGSR